MENTYSKACTEVLVILKRYLCDEDFKKIPIEEIAYLEKNMDENYEFDFQKGKPLNEQNISEKANSILVLFYYKYFIKTEEERKKLNDILVLNDKKKDVLKKEKYDINIFETDKNSKAMREKNENIALVSTTKKENIFRKLIKIIINLIYK